ncbi:MAG: hypothetical protein U1E59_01885 [Amaricoccus sp.]
MVEKDIHPTRADRDATLLAPFFAEARAGDPGPTTALLSAILADAGAVSAERRAPASPAPRGRLGGWRGLAALAACAVLGFWIGIAGNLPIEAGTTSSASYDGEASSDAGSDGGAVDQLGAFYDLASLEG